MPKKKKFIDKKKAVTFHVVHRSQHDPLTADETAPQRILVPTCVEKSSKGNNKEELMKYGIYFDDDYNYLQHLRDVDQAEVEFVETSETLKPEKCKLRLPSSVFASVMEEKIGLLNKAAPESGLKLDLDPDIVAAMDEDFDYSNPGNELEDDFVKLANAPIHGSEEYTDKEEFNSSDNCSNHSSELNDEIESLRGVETKSRFTDFSMTSSVISRNSQLILLDETFEQMFANYDEADIGALDWDEIEGEIDADSPLFRKAADEFLKEQQTEILTSEDIQKVMVHSSERNDADKEFMFEVKNEKKWDCESVLSTYSSTYNRPKLIEESLNKIRINKKTGIPTESRKLTKKALSQLDGTTREQGPPSVLSVLSTLSIRPENESLEEKKDRKRQLKEYRRARRIERKVNSQAFKEEKMKLEKTTVHNKLNRRGIVL